MANHASALKAHRQSVRRRARNRSNTSALRTGLKRFQDLVKAGKEDDARAQLPALYALVDKAVRHKVLSANAAARHKSRLTRAAGAGRAA